MSDNTNQQIPLAATNHTICGIAASPGIVIGRALNMGRRKSKRRKHTHLDDEAMAFETERFKDAVNVAEHQLTDIRNQFAENLEEYISIIDSHILMLRDKMIHDRTLELIRSQKINAEWALETALNQVRSAFSQIDDRYLRERVHDVEHVAVRIFRALEGRAVDPFDEIEEPVILVGRDFSPEDTIRMQTDKVLGFVTEMGGVTSHTAIVARSLEIPAVVGAENVCKEMASDDMLIVDGNTGHIILHPTEEQLAEYRELQRQYEVQRQKIGEYTHLPPETIDGLKVQINANIEMLEEAGSAILHGAGGIGLFRSEFYYIGREMLPDEESLYLLYKELLLRMAPLPVTIRTLDVGGDKLAGSLGQAKEANPALGLRAIRFSLREPKIFITQVRALLRASVHGALRIMFPMISSLCEVKRVKEIMREVKNSLDQEGIPYAPHIETGLMIEVPSAVSVADVLACEADFFSIGTNDLIQYALAIDRGNEHVAHMYEPLHPAVLRMIKQVVDVGHEAGIEVGLCGEMAGDITYLPLLLGLGVDELSMPPLSIPYVKRMVRHSTAEEMEALAHEALQCMSAQEVVELLGERLPSRYPDDFGDEGFKRVKKTCCSTLLDREDDLQ